MSNKIILGICSSIASYKSCELTRLLLDKNYQLTVVMTKSATKFINPIVFQALTNNKVFTDDDSKKNNGTNEMEHISLSRDAKIILIAPASANTIAKIANGICDNFLLNLVAARTKDTKLIICPAMNKQMWSNKSNIRNIELLKQDGVIILGPESGQLACGENGLGRMIDVDIILDYILSINLEKILINKKVLITTGSTYEPIDPVRGITNISSGKMGIELARACKDAGAQVSLIYGNIKTSLIKGLHKIIYAPFVDEMYEQVHKNIKDVDIFICVAAIVDFKVKKYHNKKIKKKSNICIEFKPNIDILKSVTSLKNPPFCVGFAAESENLEKHMKQKKINKKIPLVIGNIIENAINKNSNKVILLDDFDITKIPTKEKYEVSWDIIKRISYLINNN